MEIGWYVTMIFEGVGKNHAGLKIYWSAPSKPT